MKTKQVLIIGGGVAGLTTATQLAQLGAVTTVIDKAPFMGGLAITYTCKATDHCVKCGACMAAERFGRVVENERVRLKTSSRVTGCSQEADGIHVQIETEPQYIDPDRCTSCGKCVAACPPDAVVQGFSACHQPFFAIDVTKCQASKGCQACQDACPEDAIDPAQKGQIEKWSGDAVVLATGFTPFDPTDKPYGYHVFPNVITTLELEQMLRRHQRVIRPSDGAQARSIAFIQCVGSRDISLNHNWCSKVCCGSALRMAAKIQNENPEAAVTCFYIDIQTFAKNFDRLYQHTTESVELIRTIPADIYPADTDNLKVIYTETQPQEPIEALFDLVVLSIGMTPGDGVAEMAGMLGVDSPKEGFGWPQMPDGFFLAGSVGNPMDIEQAIADAGRATWEAALYLGLVEVS